MRGHSERDPDNDIYFCKKTFSLRIFKLRVSSEEGPCVQFVLNKLKSYKKAPISAQILSAIKSNEQLLNNSQCNG